MFELDSETGGNELGRQPVHNLFLKSGDKVEAYRENTPEVVEWKGTVVKLIQKSMVSVTIDGLVSRIQGFEGKPVRLTFSASGWSVQPSYGPRVRIRRISDV